MISEGIVPHKVNFLIKSMVINDRTRARHRENAVSHLVNVYWSPIPLSLPLPFPGGNTSQTWIPMMIKKCTLNNLIVQNFHSTVLVPFIHSDETIKMSTHLLVAHAAFKIFLSDTILSWSSCFTRRLSLEGNENHTLFLTRSISNIFHQWNAAFYCKF